MDTYREKNHDSDPEAEYVPLRVPEPRVVTLSPASLRLLRSFGVLQRAEQRCITPFYDMIVYEQVGNSSMRFNNATHKKSSRLVSLQDAAIKEYMLSGEDEKRAYELSLESMGASIETQHLQAALCEKLADDGHIDIKQNKVVQISPGQSQNDLPVVTLDDGTEIEARLVIGSDGEKSKTRNDFGVAAHGYSYNQYGLVCTVETAQPNPAAFQRFLRQGPIALLPLWGNYSSIVWSCQPSTCKDLQDCSPEEFVDRLNEVLLGTSDVSWLGGMIPSQLKSQQSFKPPVVTGVNTGRYAFPLTLTVANEAAAPRMALIGDAAHRIHPMAGQGLNLGMTDVAYLANTIIKAKKGGADIGNYEHVLADYNFNSKANAASVIASIEFVKNSYAEKFAGSEALGHLLALGRNIGIDVIDSSDFAKHNFMNYASGNFTHPLSYEWLKE